MNNQNKNIQKLLKKKYFEVTTKIYPLAFKTRICVFLDDLILAIFYHFLLLLEIKVKLIKLYTKVQVKLKNVTTVRSPSVKSDRNDIISKQSQ